MHCLTGVVDGLSRPNLEEDLRAARLVRAELAEQLTLLGDGLLLAARGAAVDGHAVGVNGRVGLGGSGHLL